MASVLNAIAEWKGRLWAVFFIAAAGAVAGGGAVWWLQNARYGAQLAQLQGQLEAERRAGAQAALDQSTKYRKLEADAMDALVAVTARAQEERKRDEEKAAAERAEYLAGTRRMSLAISAGQASGANGAAASATAAGAPGEARAELAPSTAAALYAIASDGDAGIRDANECIDLYNGVRRALNGDQK